MTIPTDCVLCGRPAAGVWRLPPDDRWNVPRWLVLCSPCAECEHAYCVRVDGRDDGVLAAPLITAGDFRALVAARVCWDDREPEALVPWCPVCGVRARDLYEIEDARAENLQTQRCADGRGED